MNALGIDISKKTLDLCFSVDNKVVCEEKIDNTKSCISKAINKWLKDNGVSKEQLVICAEYTGRYIFPLCLASKQCGFRLWLENPMEIKLSIGMTRGKDDKVDARRIAEYAYRFGDRMSLFEYGDESLLQLSDLDSELSLYITERAKLEAQIKDQENFMPPKTYKAKKSRMEKIIKTLDGQIEEIQKQMDDIMGNSPELSRQMEQLRSIDGVGPVVARKLVLCTVGFTKFKTARQFACYAGLAPFKHTSGTSVKSGNRVSQRANKTIKAILHMAAVAAIGMGHGELYDYFVRKKAEGKHGLSVMNAIKAKIVARAFSLIRRNAYYTQKYTPICLAIS